MNTSMRCELDEPLTAPTRPTPDRLDEIERVLERCGWRITAGPLPLPR